MFDYHFNGDPQVLTDPRVMAMPHPKRLDVLGMYAAQQHASFWKSWQPVLADPSLHLTGVLRKLESDPAMLDNYRIHLSMSEMNRGVLGTNLMHLAWKERGQKLMQTRDSLEDLLTRTDVAGHEVPCRYLRAPFPVVYIEFGQHRTSPLRIYHPLSGEHILEGAYVMQTQVKVDFDSNTAPTGKPWLEEGKEYRLVEITFTGSPLGKENLMDDATFYASFWIADENEPIETMVERSIRIMEANPDSTRIDTHQRANLTAALTHLIKVLLYLNSSTARTSLYQEETDLRQALSRVKSGKQAKLRRKLNRVYDRIMVGPETTPQSTETRTGTATGREMSAHWRRGHIREQACGPGRKDHKIIFIEPVLVRADNINAAPRNKTYVIK